MMTQSLRLVAIGLASVFGVWLVFDGVRALIVGDYVTPRSGSYAGQLGPWAQVVATVGLNPRSRGMKAAHVLIGLAWLMTAAAVGFQWAWVRFAVLACAILSLWYVPFGTFVGIVQIVLSIASSV